MKKGYYLITVLFCLLLLIFTSHKEVLSAEGYVGTDVCKACHENIYIDFIGDMHGNKNFSGTPASREGCESCHGPGAEHVRKGGGRGVEIFGFREENAQKRFSQCLSCHEESRSVAFWSTSRHKAMDVACDQCHDIHHGQEKDLKEAEPDLCFGCHRNIKAQSNKQSHHPLRERKMFCTNCHNPMGSFGVKTIKAEDVNELCYECHAERRGPFVWEHPPVAENCLNCHVPHGSNHTKLLFRKPPLLCQSCHDAAGHPGVPYTSFNSFKGPNTSNRFIARACLNCHTNIHGSNGPWDRGSHWLR